MKDSTLIFKPFGVDLEGAVAFLKNEFKLSVGFEAQTLGVGAKSAATSGMVVYALSAVGAVSPLERDTYLNELLSFRLNDGAAYSFGHLRANSWATFQLLLALRNLSADKTTIAAIAAAAASRYQIKSGGWSFDGTADGEALTFAIYPSLFFCRKETKDIPQRNEILYSTLTYFSKYTARRSTERLIIQCLGERISQALGIDTPSYISSLEVDFRSILLNEWGEYGVNLYTTSPFSMRFYSPALYLFSRDILPPEHPFNRFLLSAIVNEAIEGRSWRHVTHGSPDKPSSFCTALALLTLERASRDFTRPGATAPFSPIPKNDMPLQALNMTAPIKVFISYSSRDEATATAAVSRLRSMGFDVIYAETALLVGDSIPAYINDGLRDMDYFVLFMSRASMASVYVREEFEGAKAAEWNRRKVVILPALLEDCDVPPILAAKKYADFRESFDRGMAQVIQAIEGRNGKRGSS